jgi:hypothetical protein
VDRRALRVRERLAERGNFHGHHDVGRASSVRGRVQEDVTDLVRERALGARVLHDGYVPDDCRTASTTSRGYRIAPRRPRTAECRREERPDSGGQPELAVAPTYMFRCSAVATPQTGALARSVLPPSQPVVSAFAAVALTPWARRTLH